MTDSPPDRAPTSASSTSASASLPAPAIVGELAQSCVRFVQRAVGVELDYTPDTLSVLDHYAKAAKAEAKDRPEALHLVARAVAAYFGEVVRHEFPAFWSMPGDDVAAADLCFEDVFLSFSPFAFACTAIGFDPGKSADDDEVLPDVGLSVEEEDMADVAAHIARSPLVSEEEYVLLTTRMEVIQVVADQLKARAEARGHGDVQYEEADYED